MASPPVPARPAATALLVRDTRAGIEVLVVERSAYGFFGGLTAFPGGAVDAEDDTPLARSVVAGPEEDRVHRSAALREVAEEVGLALTSEGVVAAPQGRGRELYEAMAFRGMVLDGGSLAFVSRWITPEGAPQRFDARFYLASVADTPPVRLATDELTGWAWAEPMALLDEVEAGRRRMFSPTRAHLRWLAGLGSAEEAMDEARAPRPGSGPLRSEDGSLVPAALPGGFA